MPRIKTKQTVNLVLFSLAIPALMSMTACNKTQTSTSLITEAMQYQKKGDDKSAVIQLKNALQKNPDDPNARLLLGKIYNEIGDAQSAEKEIRKALSLGISADQALPGLGKALLAQGKFQNLLDDTKEFSVKQNTAEISTLRGSAYLALDKGPEAKESFDLALKKTPNYPDALIGLAKYAIGNRDIDTAIRFAEQAVAKNPNNADAWLFKGDLLRMQGKAELALAAYEQTLKLKPDSVQAHIFKAYLEISNKKFDAATSDIQAARKSAPNSLIVLYSQALLDFTQGRHAASLESLQQILRVAPEHMPSLLLAGAVQFALGSTQQAEQNLKKYLQTNPGNTYARKLLAGVFLKEGQAQDAIDLLTPLLKNTQPDVQLYAIAGQSYMQIKDFSKATEYFEKASALTPGVAKIHTALALSKLGQGESARAVTELELATSLDAKSPQAGILLVMTHLRLREFDKALIVIKTLEKEQPENPVIQNLKGGVYMGMQDIPNARASFQKAVSIQPDYFPAVANLAQLDMQEKKPEAAKKRFEALLQKDKKNIQAMTALASLAGSQGKKEEMKSWLERASNANPDSIPPAIQLAAYYLQTGEPKKALTLARKLQSTNTSNPDVIDLLAQAQFANGDKDAALESYNRIAILLPDSALAQFRIASIQLALQNQNASMDALKKALLLKPDYLDAQLALAQLETRKNNFGQAYTIVQQIQKQREKSPVGYGLEGDLQMMQKKPELAIKPYEKAFALAKNNTSIIKLHEALRQAGKEKEADSRINQWLKDNPADTASRLYLGTLRLMARDNKAAVEQFQTVLLQEPQNVTALNNLALAYQQENNPQAPEYAEKAYKLAGNSPAILDTFGWILIEQGNISRGLPLLQKATLLAPESPDIRYHLALGLFKSGDKINARQELEQLLSSGKNFSGIEEARILAKKLQ